MSYLTQWWDLWFAWTLIIGQGVPSSKAIHWMKNLQAVSHRLTVAVQEVRYASKCSSFSRKKEAVSHIPTSILNISKTVSISNSNCGIYSVLSVITIVLWYVGFLGTHVYTRFDRFDYVNFEAHTWRQDSSAPRRCHWGIIWILLQKQMSYIHSIQLS